MKTRKVRFNIRLSVRCDSLASTQVAALIEFPRFAQAHLIEHI